MKYFLSFLLLLECVCYGEDLLLDKESVEVYEKIKDKVIKTVTPAKDDYVNEKSRGTVYFNSETGIDFLTKKEKLNIRNYSFHKVIIPDGTTIEEVNFSQDQPHTDAISGENLIFIKCNLKNVKINKTWKLIDCLTIQAQIRTEIVDNVEYEVYEVEKDGKFIEVNREKIIDIDNLTKSE